LDDDCFTYEVLMLLSPTERILSPVHFSAKGFEMNGAATSGGQLPRLLVLAFLVVCSITDVATER
jgi:hypothetical protein